ncbi:MAG: NAD-dependent epimerase/dehydratase family protein [Clostridiaceae bacterium]
MEKIIYIVTGAAGHLGSHVADALIREGNAVRAFLLPHERIPDFVAYDTRLLSEYAGDVRDRTSLEQLFENADGARFIVIHCAGIVSISGKKDPRIYEVNVGGTKNIVDACKAHNVKRLVYVSSVHAIPLLPPGQTMGEIDRFCPENVHGQYARTKAEATQLVLDAAKEGLDAVIVHPAGIIGPNALDTGNIPSMLKKLVRGRFRIAVRGGFDFVDVRDVTKGILLAAQKGQCGECYILSNRFIDLKEFFNTFSDAAGLKRLKLYLPVFVAKAAAPFAELYYALAKKTPVFTRYSMMTLSKNALYSHEKATRELGYSTRSLKDTMKDIAAWLKRKQRRA